MVLLIALVFIPFLFAEAIYTAITISASPRKEAVFVYCEAASPTNKGIASERKKWKGKDIESLSSETTAPRILEPDEKTPDDDDIEKDETLCRMAELYSQEAASEEDEVTLIL